MSAADIDVDVHAWAVYVRAHDNLATRTIVGRHGEISEESYAARGLTLWSEFA